MIEDCDQAQRLPQTEAREYVNLLAAFTLIKPEKNLHPTIASFGGHAVHAHSFREPA